MPAGSRAWWWPRRRSGTCAGRRASSTTGSTRPSTWPRPRSLEDVWHLLFRGELPDAAASAAFAEEVRRRRPLPPGLSTLLPALSRRGTPLDVLRTAVSLLGAELGWRPTHDIDADELDDQALGLCAVVPTILAAAYRLRQGHEPVEPRDDLGFAANYLLHADRRGAEPAARPGH